MNAGDINLKAEPGSYSSMWIVLHVACYLLTLYLYALPPVVSALGGVCYRQLPQNEPFTRWQRDREKCVKRSPYNALQNKNKSFFLLSNTEALHTDTHTHTHTHHLMFIKKGTHNPEGKLLYRDYSNFLFYINSSSNAVSSVSVIPVYSNNMGTLRDSVSILFSTLITWEHWETVSLSFSLLY